jgi:TIR domain
MTTESGAYRYDVFISYSHCDRVWVQETLLPQLESAGLRVCIDYRDFIIGTPTLINIEQVVDTSRHTLIVLTPAWVESEWTQLESLLVGTADPAARQRRLIPLLLKPCQCPSRIAALTHADFTQPEQHATEFTRLLGQLRRNTAPPPSLPTALPPFVAGPPITQPRHFFGRERELRRLFGLWQAPPLQNAAIVGPRRSGKTSLLLYLQCITTTQPAHLRSGHRDDWLPEPTRYRWVFVDFQDIRLGSRDGLLRYLLRSLSLPVPTPCDLDRFMEVMSQGLRTPTVILLDEMEAALQRYPELDNAFWEGLRSLASHAVAGNLAFVLAAGSSPAHLAHHNQLSSPFFNIFGYTVSLGPLTVPEAQALVASAPRLFSAADEEWILAHSGRWPLLLQILCRERLMALDEGVTDAAWQEEGLRQITPFRHLLEG